MDGGCMEKVILYGPEHFDLHPDAPEVFGWLGCGENTPCHAAFQAAWEDGADWIELDVQQTKDGRIVVLHDANTRRTTGVNGNVWNMTYEQVAPVSARLIANKASFKFKQKQIERIVEKI